MNTPQGPQIQRGANLQVNDLQTLRGSALGQVHFGNLNLAPERKGIKALVKSGYTFNIAALLFVWLTFRFLDLFPPHDQPFMSAVGWFFFFGLIYAGIAFLVLRVGLTVEAHAVARAVAANRRYQWHSQYDTSKLTPEELKKVVEPPTPPHTRQKAPVGVADKFYKFAGFLSWASLLSGLFGVYSFMNTVAL